MATYRLYQLKDNRIIGGSVLEAADDAEALRHAHRNIHFDAVEVWDQDRRIAMVSAPVAGKPES